MNVEDLREETIQLQVQLHKLRQKRRYRDNKTLEEAVTHLARVRRCIEAVAYSRAC